MKKRKISLYLITVFVMTFVIAMSAMAAGAQGGEGVVTDEAAELTTEPTTEESTTEESTTEESTTEPTSEPTSEPTTEPTTEPTSEEPTEPQPDTLEIPKLISVKDSNSGIEIVWGTVDGADGYYVYRRVPSGKWARIATTALTSYTDGGVTYNQSYYYTVRAYNTKTISSYMLPGLGIKMTKLLTPKLLSGECLDSCVKISWEKVEGAQSYNVFRRTTGTWEKLDSVAGKTTAFVDLQAKYGVTYIYTVRAYAKGVSSGFDAAGLKVEVDKVFTPRIISVDGYYSGTTLRWHGLKFATGYNIYRSSSAEGEFTKIASVGEDVEIYSDRKVAMGESYYYKISTVYGEAESALTGAELAEIKLQTPVVSKMVSSTAKSIKIGWNTVYGATGYRVYRKAPSGSWAAIGTVKGKSNISFTDSTAAGAYYYRVYAYRTVSGKNYYSSPSAYIRARVLGTPSVTVSGSGQKHLVKWNKLPGATSYQVYSRAVGNPWKLTGTVTGTSYTNTVNSGTYYFYRVRALSKLGNTVSYGQFSAEKKFMISTEPKYSVAMDTATVKDCIVVAMYVENYGASTLRIYSSGARLIDKDKAKYNRNLTMFDFYAAAEYGDIYNLSYVDVPPGYGGVVAFYPTNQTPTWYDKNTTIQFKFRYESVNYVNKSTSAGSVYERI